MANITLYAPKINQMLSFIKDVEKSVVDYKSGLSELKRKALNIRGSFLEGFADGALSGAVSGAITGAACAGLGALGALAGKSIQCMSTVGKAINVTSKVTAALSFGMDGFDMLAMGVSLFDPSNALVEFNRKLHSSALYNGFQIAVNALAVFSAGAASTMKCFVAGTMILTVAGLVAIENIKAGDKVIATNPETFEVAEKTVLETYVRETTELLHLRINGEVIKTTFEHPFYVKDVGFVEAGKLQVGDKLVDSRGNVLVLEGKKLEITDKPVKVYNFKVDNFHTYHVGENRVLVHNANKYVKGTSKTEIIGKPHASAQHQAFTMDEVNKLSSTGEFSKIYINKSLKTAGFNGTQKPDIIAVGKNGNGHIVEIAGPSQLSGKPKYALKNKFNTMLQNNPGMTGDLIFPEY
ncbi:HINT domain-containing protein [Acetivibrio thermocellus]